MKLFFDFFFLLSNANGRDRWATFHSVKVGPASPSWKEETHPSRPADRWTTKKKCLFLTANTDVPEGEEVEWEAAF